MAQENRYGIGQDQWMCANETLLIDISAHTTIVTENLNTFGRAHRLILVVPDLDDTDTVTVSIIDAFGNVLYTAGTLAESTTHDKDLSAQAGNVILTKGCYIKVEASGAQTAERTLKYYIYGLTKG